LETIGGTGKVLIEMDAADDLFDAAVGKTITSGSTGVGTKTTALLPDPTQMQPAVYVRNFTTDKKYVRCNCSNVEDNFGKVWIFLTANAFQRI
jgi:hypothetical protein